MKPDYRNWLIDQGYRAKTIGDRLAELARIETEYGPVDARVRHKEYDALIDLLTYSTDDARQNRRNPTRFAINGDLRTNLATYKSALRLYKRFLDAREAQGPSCKPALQAPSLGP